MALVMVGELGAVTEGAVACAVVRSTLPAFRAVRRLVSHLLLLILLLQLLLLGEEVGARVLVEVVFERLAPIEVLVGLRDRVTLVLDLLDLLEVVRQVLALVLRALPVVHLLHDSVDRLILNHRVDVDGVVHAAEDAALV